MKFRSKKIYFPVWATYVELFIGKDVNDLSDIVVNKYNLNIDRNINNASAFTLNGLSSGISRIIFSYDSTVDTIAHEAWHAVYFMMKYHGAEIEDEVVAYHLGYLVGEIHKFIALKFKSRGSHGRPSNLARNHTRVSKQRTAKRVKSRSKKVS